MKLLLISFLLNLFNNLEGKADWDTYDKHHYLVKSQGVINWKPCAYNKDVVHDFRDAIYNVTIETFKRISVSSKSHFVFSPYSLWMTLAAIYEGTTGQTSNELSDFLLLPQDECALKQFYELAVSLEPAGKDVKLSRKSMLIQDNSLNLNGHWENLIHRKTLLHTSSAPIKSDPDGAAAIIRNDLKLQLLSPNLDGNSVIIDTLNFDGLWTQAFSDVITERAPFFDDLGKKVGYVDLMKIRARVKMTYISSMNTKVLELPVGFDGRYRMLFGLNLGTAKIGKSVASALNSVFFDIWGSLKESIVPIDVAIPRFRMTTEIDMRKFLEDLGVKALWNDAEGTKNISDPAALPSSFIQRTTVTFDSTGIKPPIQEVRNIVPPPGKGWAYNDSETGLDPILERDFIVDRPFLFGLFDSKTYSCLFCAAFSVPTYRL